MFVTAPLLNSRRIQPRRWIAFGLDRASCLRFMSARGRTGDSTAPVARRGAERHQRRQRDVVQEGVLALYRGWLPSVIGVVPYVGLNFAVYETLKDIAVKRYGVESDRELSSTLRLSAGGVAGTIGQTIAYPFDVVRRRLQVCRDTQSSPAPSPPVACRYPFAEVQAGRC